MKIKRHLYIIIPTIIFSISLMMLLLSIFLFYGTNGRKSTSAVISKIEPNRFGKRAYISYVVDANQYEDKLLNKYEDWMQVGSSITIWYSVNNYEDFKIINNTDKNITIGLYSAIMLTSAGFIVFKTIQPKLNHD